MNPLSIIVAICFGLLAAPPAHCIERRIEGRLDAQDRTLSEGQYYDDIVFDAQAGQSVKFMITMADWTPYAMLYSDDGRLVEHTTGSYSAGRYALGTQWQIPDAGRWHLIVTISGRDEVPYSLTWDVID